MRGDEPAALDDNNIYCFNAGLVQQKGPII